MSNHFNNISYNYPDKSNLDFAKTITTLQGRTKSLGTSSNITLDIDPIKTLIDQNASLLGHLEPSSHTPDQMLLYFHLALYKKKTVSVDSIIEIQKQHKCIQDNELLTHYMLWKQSPSKMVELVEVGIYTLQSIIEFQQSLAAKNTLDKTNLLHLITLIEKTEIEKNISDTKGKTAAQFKV